MRFTLILALVTLIPSASWAASATCSLPQAFVTRAQELCEEARIREKVPAADWTTDMCATYMMRRGFRDFSQDVKREEVRTAAEDLVIEDRNVFDTANPGTLPAAVCGDGVLEAEFEECDDGNNDNGDGCDARCFTEAP